MMIDFITNYIGIRALAVIVAILLIIAVWCGICLNIKADRLDAANARNATLTVQLQQVGNQIKAQNVAVDQMLANAAVAAERLKAAQVAAGKIEIVTQERIQYIQLAAIPVTCPEAVTWGALHAIEIGTRWQEATP